MKPDPLDRLIAEMERTGEIVTLPDGTKRATKPPQPNHQPGRLCGVPKPTERKDQ